MANEAETRAEEKERTVVKFTNPDTEAFTHPFRGVTIKVEAGESYPARLPEAELLAHHLARKILSREAKKAIADRSKDVPKYTSEQVAALAATFITPIGVQDREVLTPEQQRARDQEALREQFPQVAKPVEVTKAEVIADLKSRGIEPDISKSKDDLLRDLMEAEAQGIKPKA